MAPDVLTAPPAARSRTLTTLRRAGVGVVRQTFDWRQIEPRPGRWRWAATDGWVAAAARAGIEVLPVVFGAPGWAAAPARRGTSAPPRQPARFGAFAAALVRRYGRGGTLWRAHPGLPRRPVRSWQIWNEPNLTQFWGGRYDAAAYVRLLRAANGAIHRADRRADVVSAGLPNSRGGAAFPAFVEQMYRAGAKGAFDVFGLHPYAPTPDAVETTAGDARDLLDRLGDDRTPLWVTELGWADAGPASPFTVGAGDQARYIAAVLHGLAVHRGRLRLRGVVYYSWRDGNPSPADSDFFGFHTGLLTVDGMRKPAYRSFLSTTRALQQR